MKHRSLLLLLTLGCFNVLADDHVINLVVRNKIVNFTGKNRTALAVNNQIPAPTLHFKEGDHVTLNVYNHLNQGTAIHWHGLLIPWQMDGVEGITQSPIMPGGVFHYEFTLHQSGTYWYHAHAGFQEQQGLYGALIIDPKHKPRYFYNKDYVVVLSDWHDTHPNKVFKNLKKDGDYYASRFPIQPSLAHFIHDYLVAKTSEDKKELIQDYKMMQNMRMSIYDVSDVAYDAFLLNGHSNQAPWTAQVKPGDTVRLRFIAASGSTNFRIKIPDATMKIVQVQGNDVKPQFVHDFTILPGETYDVVIKILKNKPYIIYAQSADTLGAAYGALITKPQQSVNYQSVKPFPEPKPVTQEMMHNMMGSHHDTSKMSGMNHPAMNHHAMEMPTEATIVRDTIEKPSQNRLHQTTIGTKYQNLTAAVKTNNPHKPVDGIIRIELFGYMDRYIWFINGVPEYQTKPMIIEPGKRYRIIFTNESMMHHPMHLHGHWFILRNGHGAYDPLLHTIDVAPGATVVADFDGDASGQWFFHCHHLYHMMAGMARILQYSTIIKVAEGKIKPSNIITDQVYANQPIVRVDSKLPLDTSMIQHPMGHPAHLYSANFLELSQDFFDNLQTISFKGLYGGDYNKLELNMKDAEIKKGMIENADLDIFYWYLLNQFWAVKAGMNYVYRPTPYWQPGIGIEGLMPYFIDTDLRAYYHQGGLKFNLELSRDTQITNTFLIKTDIVSILSTKTVHDAEIGSGLNQIQLVLRPYYRVRPGLNLFIEYERDQYYGSTKKLLQANHEATQANSFKVGIAVLF
jgi:FtsP/CotA-like multicopper oxidase with cupredoxin domain